MVTAAFLCDAEACCTQTENDYANRHLGAWRLRTAALRYGRVAHEFASGGVGPHDIKRVLPGAHTLRRANGWRI